MATQKEQDIAMMLAAQVCAPAPVPAALAPDRAAHFEEQQACQLEASWQLGVHICGSSLGWLVACMATEVLEAC